MRSLTSDESSEVKEEEGAVHESDLPLSAAGKGGPQINSLLQKQICMTSTPASECICNTYRTSLITVN